MSIRQHRAVVSFTWVLKYNEHARGRIHKTEICCHRINKPTHMKLNAARFSCQCLMFQILLLHSQRALCEDITITFAEQLLMRL